MYCGECGHKLAETDKVCPKCGTKTTNNDIKETILKNKNISNKIHSINKKLLIIVLMALLIVFIVIFVYKKNNYVKEDINDSNLNSSLSKTNIYDYSNNNRILLSNINAYMDINCSVDNNTTYDVQHGETDNTLTITKIKVIDKRNIDPNIDYLYIWELVRENIWVDSRKTYTSKSEYGYTSIDTLLYDIKWIGKIYNYENTPNTYQITFTYSKEDNTNENGIYETKNNKDYYEPIELYKTNGINGMYKEPNSNTKYIIQDDQIEYWEENYIYLGTIYMQKENELEIIYNSRYEYDETENKYKLERYGNTLLLKVNKEGELLTINSENELIDSNGTKYTKENKYQISIGISGTDITQGLIANSYNMPVGVYVKDIEENSPADKAGVKPGDIITKLNNKTITSLEELNTLKNNSKVGDTISLTIYRENNYITLSIILTENN